MSPLEALSTDISGAGLTGEDFKTAALQLDPDRTADTVGHVGHSEYEKFGVRTHLGPYVIEELFSSNSTALLRDPRQVAVVTCGRNEHNGGRLVPTLGYLQESTGYAGNVYYADGESTDGSEGIAIEMGLKVLPRREVLDKIYKLPFAKVLAVDERIFEGRPIFGQPILRKGMEALRYRYEMMKMKMGKKLPKYWMLIDSDLCSIPGGTIAGQLPPEQVYYPLQLMARGLVELETSDTNKPMLVEFTGSFKRNNEGWFGWVNSLRALATAPFLSSKQRDIAQSYFAFLNVPMHPLTGELTVLSEVELNAPGATAWGLEPVRNVYFAGLLAELYGTGHLSKLSNDTPIHIANVRRGQMQRADARQDDKKEFIYVLGDVTQIGQVLVLYAVMAEKYMHQWTLEDYKAVNDWLFYMDHTCRIDHDSHSKVWEYRSIDRVIPPVPMLVAEEILALD